MTAHKLSAAKLGVAWADHLYGIRCGDPMHGRQRHAPLAGDVYNTDNGLYLVRFLARHRKRPSPRLSELFGLPLSLTLRVGMDGFSYGALSNYDDGEFVWACPALAGAQLGISKSTIEMLGARRPPRSGWALLVVHR